MTAEAALMVQEATSSGALAAHLSGARGFYPGRPPDLGKVT